MISAASRVAAAELDEQVSALLNGPSAAGADRQQIAEELYSVAQLLNAQPRLRRSLGDASTDATRRGDLSRDLLRGKVGEVSVQIVAAAVEHRWSSPWDLVDSLEISADEVLLAAAEQAGSLDAVEGDLFRFERILAGSGALTAVLDDANAEPQRRVALLQSLLDGKVDPISLSLITHAVTSARKRRIEPAMDDLLEASAVRRNRSVARVISASQLTEAQSSRLKDALARMYGREISIRVAIDPSVRGGLVVRLGDEVIDGTVATRMAAARAALAT